MRAGQWQRKTILCLRIRWGDFDVRNSCIALPHSLLHGGTARLYAGIVLSGIFRYPIPD